MAFSVVQYLDIIHRAEQDQSTPDGRLARTILLDPTWSFTASSATQQSAIDSKVDGILLRHTRTHGTQHDATTLKTIVASWYTQAGG